MAMRHISQGSDEQHRHKKLLGMERAFEHAAEMLEDGKITSKELDEFRRYLIGESTDVLTMDEYAKLRETGGFDELRSWAGQSPDEDERHPRDLKSSREAIARKVVGNFVTLLWSEGLIDDQAYMEQMEKVGLPPHMADAREKARMTGGEEPDVGMEAVEMWERTNSGDGEPADLGALLQQALPDDEGEAGSTMAVTPEEIEEFRRRHGKSRVAPAIVRERVVDAPST